MDTRLSILLAVGAVALIGFAWYEHSRPPARVVALVAALTALAVAARLILAPVPNLVGTTDVAVLTGYALGGGPGFAVGALAAPISNIWLGQGPWTLWQMAGWGLCGAAGAGLALLTARRLGRLGLAAACALAGLLYGALLDLSVMVTYGGEQSLDRYVAISATGVPFNVVHAAGNFTIAFVAGPALVRMIARFRDRLAFTWHPAGALPALLGALVVTLSLALPDRAEAAATGKSVRWLAQQQNADGGFPGTPGGSSSALITSWVMLGLEAGERNPLDVRKRGRSPVDFLRRSASSITSTGDLERTILALHGAGVSPRRFAGRDLVSELRRRRSSNGSFEGQVNLTAFGILALEAAGGGAPASSVKWLRSAANGNGGWGISPSQPSDADSTGAALQALAAAGGGGSEARDGAAFLARSQRSDGSWQISGGAANSQSTAWALQGLAAQGGEAGALSGGLRYLAARRSSSGAYSYSASMNPNPVWVTAQAITAVERDPFPIAPVRRAPGGAGGGGGGSAGPEGGVGDTATATGASGQGAGGSGGAPGRKGSSRGNGNAPGERGSGAAAREDSAEDELTDAALAADAALGEPGSGENGSGRAIALGGGVLALALGGGFLWYRRTLA